MLGCAGDVPTLETLAAAAILRERLPDLKVRVVNVVDLMRLQPETRAPARAARRRVRLALHARPAGRLRLPRLPVADPPAHLPAHEPRQPPRARLQGGGHDDDAVRHGHAQRPRPLPPRDRRDRPGARARRSARRTSARRWRTSGCAAAHTRASTARTAPDVAGLGLARPRRQRRLDEPEAAPRRRDDERDGRSSRSTRRRATRRRAPGRARRRALRRAGADRRRGAAAIERARALAPLHNAPALRGDRRGTARASRTSRTSPSSTRRSTRRCPRRRRATPCREAGARWGVRRYGFHGLVGRVGRAEQVPVPRLVVCHLGGGCSVTAVRDGRSVDTTMGFTPLEGVPMATRSGSVDPGALLYLLREAAARSTSSTTRSSTSPGCRRSSAASGDVRELGGARARRLRTGSRPRSPRWPPRSAASTRSPSPAASARTRRSSATRSPSGSRFLGAHVHVVPAREELVIARHVRRLLA